MRKGYPSWIELAVLGYCLIQARDLPSSWWTAPAVRWGWIAFIVWLLPVILYTATSIIQERTKETTSIFFISAIVASLVGTMGSLNILKHGGLALAFAGMLPFSWPVLLWLPASIAWMPGFGWLMKSIPFQLIFVVQLAITGLGSLLLVQRNRRWLSHE